MANLGHDIFSDDSGEDIAEYAMLFAGILVLIILSVMFVGLITNTLFPSSQFQ